MSPRRRNLRLMSLETPPKSERAIAVLISSWPYIDGAIDLMMRLRIRSSRASARTSFSSSSVRRKAAKRSSFLLIWFASIMVEKTGKPFLAFSDASKLLR